MQSTIKTALFFRISYYFYTLIGIGHGGSFLFLTSILQNDDDGDSTSPDYKGELIKAFISGQDYFNELRDVDVLIWHVGDRSVRENAYLALSKAYMENDIQNDYEEQYINLPSNYDIPEIIEKCLSQGYEIVCNTQDQIKKQQFIWEQIIGSKEPNGVEHAKEPDGKTHNKLQKQNYGYLTISHNMDLNSSEQQDLVLRAKILANDYAQYLLGSRYFRKSVTAEFVRSLKYGKRKKSEELLCDLVDFLTKQLSATGAKYIAVQKESHGMRAEHMDEKVLQFSSQHLESYNLNQTKLSQKPVRKNYFKTGLNELSLIRDTDQPNILIMPLYEPSIEFVDCDFCEYEKFLTKGKRGTIYNHAVCFTRKHRTRSISKTFSETDVQIAKTAGIQFGGSFGRLRNDFKQALFIQNMDNLTTHKMPDAKSTFELISQFLECKSVSVFHRDLAKSDKVEIDYWDGVRKSDSPNKPIEEYHKKMQRQLVVPEVIERLNTKTTLYGFDKMDDSGSLEFAFASDNNNLYIVASEIDKLDVSEPELRLFYFIASEMSLRFKRLEEAKIRSGMMAQINHLVHSPMHVLADDLFRIASAYKRLSKNQANWKKFIEHPIWKLRISKTLDYANLLKNLLESSKFLFLDEKFVNANLVSMNLTKVYGDASSATKNTHNLIYPDKRIVIYSEFGNLSNFPVKGDFPLLLIVFNNLIDNALKFSLEKYSSEYFSRKLNRNDLLGTDKAVFTKFSLINQTNTVRFTIQSIGTFLPKEEIHRIRLPGERGEHAYNIFKVNGTGIGLPLIEKIINLHTPASKLIINSQKLKIFEEKAALNTFSFDLPLSGKAN